MFDGTFIVIFTSSFVSFVFSIIVIDITFSPDDIDDDNAGKAFWFWAFTLSLITAVVGSVALSLFHVK